MLIYTLELGGTAVGFGSIAVSGPWKEKPTVLEFYVMPELRTRAFDLFEVLLDISGARFMEIQSNDLLPAIMLHTYARDIASEKIVFHDKAATELPSHGATLRQVTSNEETRAHIEQQQGGAEWVLELDGNTIGQGGIMFHYNRPYADIYMEVTEPFRRRG